jgi:16S rRNA (guanine966-N2)-methyltransferase
MRIIAGKYKSRRLISPPTSSTRPTSDRARESIFNIIKSLKPEIYEGAYVLDAFAGSGALGLEALSRGASQVTFMEKNPQTAQTIKANIAHLSAESQCTIMITDATKPPKTLSSMTLVFLDPPYDQIVEDICLEALLQQGWIDNETLIILETSTKREVKLPQNAALIDQRRYGAALVSLIRIQPAVY